MSWASESSWKVEDEQNPAPIYHLYFKSQIL